MTRSAWTEDRINRLKTLWREGRSAAAIADDLGSGISRSAVIGKVYRLGLSKGGHGLASVAPRETRKPRGAADPVAAVAEPTATAPRRLATDGPEYGLATILTVRRCQCRWPYGEPEDSAFKLCGRPVARGAFCGAHAEMGYRPPPGGAGGLLALAGLT